MNRSRFRSDMQAAWELRPETDATPGTAAHHNRFQAPKKEANRSKTEKTGDKKS